MYLSALVLIPAVVFLVGMDAIMGPIHRVGPLTPFHHLVLRAEIIFVIVLPLVRIATKLVSAIDFSMRVADYPESVEEMRDKLETLHRKGD